MADINDRDRDVLHILARGRANPYLIREETGLDKGDVNTILNRLGRGGYLEQVTRGLYEITPKGRDKLGPEARLEPYETGFLESTEVLDDAEDVKTVRFEGSRGTADIAVTDESMEMFVETAEEVFKRINVHMGDIRELFDEARENNDA